MEPIVTETVEITFVKRPPAKIELDIDALTWDDVMALETTDTAKLMEIIQKCVPGQDVRKLPASTLKPVIEAVTQAISSVTTGEKQKN
jgi:hypothetical protein